jgi:hypothetical protein
MKPKLKRQLLKSRTERAIKIERSTKVRPGWHRYTTYYSSESVAYIKAEAARREMWVMDLIAEMIDGYKKNIGDTNR